MLQAFSAQSLRQRYLQLHPEAADGAEAAAPAPPSVTATELTEADHEESNETEADWKQAQNEETKHDEA